MLRALDDLAYLPASDALAQFHSRRLSPVELLEAVIERAEAVEPLVNALPIRFFDEALAAARGAEARYLGRGPRPRPLEGLPASFCGVVGFKPPYGRVPEEPPCNLDHRCHEGPLARTVADCAYLGEHRELMTPYAVDFAELAERVAKEDFVRGLELEAKAYERLAALLERHRVLVCTAFSVPALEAGEDYVARGHVVNGVEHDVWDLLVTLPFNICSRCPVLCVPSGFARSGVPTGLQIVGRSYDDVSGFCAGAALERLRPWLDTPGRRPRLKGGFP